MGGHKTLLGRPDRFAPAAAAAALGAQDRTKALAIITSIPARRGLAAAPAFKTHPPTVVAERAFFPHLLARHALAHLIIDV